jgi:hypothetical protein
MARRHCGSVSRLTFATFPGLFVSKRLLNLAFCRDRCRLAHNLKNSESKEAPQRISFMNSSNLKSMNMKKTSAKLLAIIFLYTLALAPLRAQTNAPLENEMSNAVAATSEAQVATNKHNANHPPVRIDESGIHVGGPNPVDINIPSFARHGMANFMFAQNIIIIMTVMTAWVLVVGIVFYFKHRQNKTTNETLRAMIEKGLPITPELVESLKSKRSKSETEGSRSHMDLRKGLILTGVGIGVILLCGKVGWIVLFLGLAFVVIGMLNLGKGNDNNDQPPKP